MILAIDTSGEIASVALTASDGAPIAEITFPAKGGLETRLVPAIDAVLAMAGVSRDAITALAAGLGPGSFTGLRVGLVLLKAIASARALPLLGVPSLAALALNAAGHDRVLALGPARVGHLFVARYDARNIPPIEIQAPRSCALDTFALEAPHVVVGPPAGVASMARILGDRAIRVPGMQGWPRACAIALLAAPGFAAGQASDPAALEPIYLTGPDVLYGR